MHRKEKVLKIKYTYDLAKRLSKYDFNDFSVKYKYDSNAKILKKDYKNLSSKLKKINIAFRILYLLLGPSKYFLFLRFLRSYSRPESQLHILESQLMMK